MIEPRRIQATHERLQCVVKSLRRVALVAGTPDGDGGMVAIAQDFVAHVGHVGVEVGGIGAVGWVGLEEFVPDQDAVLVAELVEVFVSGLADPVADEIEVGDLVHADLGFEALARDALEGFVDAPVAAADEDARAVDRDGEVFGVGDGIGDFADAEGDVCGVRDVLL